MTPRATVLYEDTMRAGAGGSYPLHDLVMRMVEDDINGHTWVLQRQVFGNPRKGIGNVLNDVRTTDLVAGAGTLFILVDRDRIAEHLKLAKSATEAELVAQLGAISDAPARLQPFFLHPNVEGLLRTIQSCDASVLPDSMAIALKKDLTHRDLVFNEVKKADRRAVRDCVRRHQPGVAALVEALAALLPAPPAAHA